jgi:hypothetical protein
MPYIERDPAGRIVRVAEQPSATALEFIELDRPELRDYLERTARSSELLESLQATDADFVRVVEDLIELLTGKGLIAVEELPDAVRRKLDARAALRRGYRESPLLRFDDDVI